MADRIVGDRLCELLHEGGALRARSHQVQVSLEHVDHLGNLVEAGDPEDLPQAGDPGIVLRRPPGAAFPLGVLPHRPELDDPEDLPSLAHPFLAVEDGPRRVDLDEERRHEKDRREKEKKNDACQQADHAPGKEQKPRLAEPFLEDEVRRGEIVDGDAPGEFFEEGGPLHDFAPLHAQVQQGCHRVPAAAFAEGHDQLAHLVFADQVGDLGVVPHDPAGAAGPHVGGVRVAGEPDQLEPEPLPLEDLLPHHPGGLPRSHDEDVRLGREAGQVDVEGDPPEEEEDGDEQDGEVVHRPLDAELGDGVGDQADADADESHREEEGEEELPPRLRVFQVVHVQEIHARLADECHDDSTYDRVLDADRRLVAALVQDEETRQDGDEDDPPLHEEADGATDGEEPVFEGDHSRTSLAFMAV